MHTVCVSIWPLSLVTVLCFTHRQWVLKFNLNYSYFFVCVVFRRRFSKLKLIELERRRLELKERQRLLWVERRGGEREREESVRIINHLSFLFSHCRRIIIVWTCLYHTQQSKSMLCCISWLYGTMLSFRSSFKDYHIYLIVGIVNAMVMD